jgi:hypothetical protein
MYIATFQVLAVTRENETPVHDREKGQQIGDGTATDLTIHGKCSK